MANPATYLLRIMNKGVIYYLSNVSPNGCNVEFDIRIDHGWRFSESERAALMRDHGHIRGRWVVMAREQKRAAIRAAQEGGAA